VTGGPAPDTIAAVVSQGCSGESPGAGHDGEWKEVAMESTEHRAGSRTTGRDWLERAGVPLHPTTAPEALAALSTVAAELARRGDGRAAFPDVYGIITRRVCESVALGDRGLFAEPRFISRLAGRFCERYLQTLAWSLDLCPQDASAWEIAYAAGDHGRVPPIQAVLLGLSAHINFDLAIGIYRTIVELGGKGDLAKLRRYRHDHDAVNDLLRASIPEAFDHLIAQHHCDTAALLFRRAYALSEWTAMRVLSSWRSRVWDDAMTLLHARRAGERERVIDEMEQRSRRYARLLSVPPLWLSPSPEALPEPPSVRAVRAVREAARFVSVLH
jgi:hypothetical protein